jgi:hypothetical protein
VLPYSRHIITTHHRENFNFSVHGYSYKSLSVTMKFSRNTFELFCVSCTFSEKKSKNLMCVIYRKPVWYLICGPSGTESKAQYICTSISMSEVFLAPVAENRELKKKRRTLWGGDCFRTNIEAKKLNNTTPCRGDVILLPHFHVTVPFYAVTLPPCCISLNTLTMPCDEYR